MLAALYVFSVAQVWNLRYPSKAAILFAIAFGGADGTGLGMESSSELLTEPTAMPVNAAIARRVSCRAYQSIPVPEAHLMRILEAARLAPSACNQQPWRFAVVRDPDLRRRIVEDGFLPGAKMTWAIDAPVHVVIGMERSFVTHRLAPSVSGVDYP